MAGALIFMLFIDQVKSIVPPSMKYYIYADDVKFVEPIKSEADATRLKALLNDFTS